MAGVDLDGKSGVAALGAPALGWSIDWLPDGRLLVTGEELTRREPDASKRGDAVLISVDDYRALEEAAYLLRSPANVRRLLEGLDHARAGNVEAHDLDR